MLQRPSLKSTCAGRVADAPILTSKQRQQLCRKLLVWFARRQRPLPWRRDRDPYRIWVSEVMLQQTQAATVVPYFERFLATFPTLADLAAADEQDVLRAWEGLGYYRRARNLHRSAQQIVAGHGGQFPSNPAVAAALPGLGRYMIGAILSQAFEYRLPILEANSERVFCRLLGIRENPRHGQVRGRLWHVAESLLPRRQIGNFNQALMELGALICTPKHPNCPECPLIRECSARRLGIQDKIPTRRARVPTQEVHEAAVVIMRGKHVLIVQCPDSGRWAGMWEFPHGPLENGETHAQAACRLARQRAGIRVQMGPELLTLRHSVMRYRITMKSFEANYVSRMIGSKTHLHSAWVEPQRVTEFPVSAPQRRLAEALNSRRR